MKLYFDTSCLVAIMLEEPGATRLAEWQSSVGRIEPAMSDFGRGEAAATLAKLVRMARVPREEMRRWLVTLDTITSSWSHAAIEPDDITAATDFVLRVELGLRLPDAIHIAVARRREAGFVTLDRKQHQAAAALGLVCQGPLSDPPTKAPPR